jgi:hypothetical protein
VSTWQEDWITLDQFLAFMARRGYWYGMYVTTALEEGAPGDDDGDALMEGHAELARALEQHGGEYGDVHLEDLAQVLMKGADWDAKHGQVHLDPRQRLLRQRFTKAVHRTVERARMVYNAIWFTQKMNDAFPDFQDPELRQVRPIGT